MEATKIPEPGRITLRELANYIERMNPNVYPIVKLMAFDKLSPFLGDHDRQKWQDMRDDLMRQL